LDKTCKQHRAADKKERRAAKRARRKARKAGTPGSVNEVPNAADKEEESSSSGEEGSAKQVEHAWNVVRTYLASNNPLDESCTGLVSDISQICGMLSREPGNAVITRPFTLSNVPSSVLSSLHTQELLTQFEDDFAQSAKSGLLAQRRSDKVADVLQAGELLSTITTTNKKQSPQPPPLLQQQQHQRQQQ
jgi:hypothetical protein